MFAPFPESLPSVYVLMRDVKGWFWGQPATSSTWYMARGCSFYAWLTRRNQTRPAEGEDNYMTYCFSTDMQDQNIVFGGEAKLKEAIREAYEIFKPKAIGIFSTCPVGLIGDDVHSVARDMKAELGINIFGFSCEGYRGVSQSAGHHIANNGVFKNVVGLNDRERTGKNLSASWRHVRRVGCSRMPSAQPRFTRLLFLSQECTHPSL